MSHEDLHGLTRPSESILKLQSHQLSKVPIGVFPDRGKPGFIKHIAPVTSSVQNPDPRKPRSDKTRQIPAAVTSTGFYTGTFPETMGRGHLPIVSGFYTGTTFLTDSPDWHY